MPAIRLLDTEHQTELAYLHEQLIEGEPVQVMEICRRISDAVRNL